MWAAPRRRTRSSRPGSPIAARRRTSTHALRWLALGAGLIAGACLLHPAPLAAQRAQRIRVNFGEEDIAQVARTIAQALKMTLILDPSERSGSA